LGNEFEGFAVFPGKDSDAETGEDDVCKDYICETSVASRQWIS
jgi:hypothetical protein